MSDKKPKYISVEMSQIELLLKLRDLGYDRFKLITPLDLQAIELRGIKPHVRILRSTYRLANYRWDDRKLSLRVARAGASRFLKLASALGLGPWGVSTLKSRRLPEWKFTEGCSGTFGEDLPGEWLTWEEIAYLWLRELREYRMMGRELWCDLHATTSTEK